MTDKLYKILTDPNKIKADIKRIAERMEDTRLMMLPSGIRYDTDKIKSSPSDPMIKFAVKMDELDKQKQKLTDKYFIARDKLIKLIDSLDDSIQKDIIQQRYIQGYTFDRIADNIGFSSRHTYRMYESAIEFLDKSCH